MLPSGLGVKVDVVDLVTSVVVSGEDNGTNESLLSVGVEVLPAELENVRQVIADSLGAEDAVRDVDAEHDAVTVTGDPSLGFSDWRMVLLSGN